jgi:PAS domain S-box-containing protein
VPVIARSGEVLGGLFFGHPEVGVFTEQAERLAGGVAAQAAVAIENARLFEQAQHEIAERRRTEKSLRENEERLRLALAAGRMGTWDWDIATDEVTWAPELEAIHGLLPGSFGRSFAAFQKDVHPEDRDRILREIARTLESGENHHIEYRIVRPDGSLRWVDGRGKLFRDGSGAPTRMVGLCMDVTERKQAEQALRRSEVRYRRTLSLMPAAVYSCDVSGLITYCNERAIELWGRAPQIGDTDERFCGSEQMILPDGTPLPHEQCPMAVALREGRSFRNAEVNIRRPDGSQITVLVNIDPIRNEDGTVVGAINAFHDVSAIKRAEQAARESEARLRLSQQVA